MLEYPLILNELFVVFSPPPKSFVSNNSFCSLNGCTRSSSCGSAQKISFILIGWNDKLCNLKTFHQLLSCLGSMAAFDCERNPNNCGTIWREFSSASCKNHKGYLKILFFFDEASFDIHDESLKASKCVKQLCFNNKSITLPPIFYVKCENPIHTFCLRFHYRKSMENKHKSISSDLAQVSVHEIQPRRISLFIVQKIK